MVAAQTGTKYDKIILKKWYTIYKDHIRLCDCKDSRFLLNVGSEVINGSFLFSDEIHDGMNLELYYQWESSSGGTIFFIFFWIFGDALLKLFLTLIIKWNKWTIWNIILVFDGNQLKMEIKRKSFSHFSSSFFGVVLNKTFEMLINFNSQFPSKDVTTFFLYHRDNSISNWSQ